MTTELTGPSGVSEETKTNVFDASEPRPTMGWIVTGAIALGIALGMVVLLFFHELGHAIPVLLAGGRSRIVIGSDDGWTVPLGSLRVTVGLDGPTSIFLYGSTYWDGVEPTRVRALGLLGGPLVSVTAILVLGGLSVLDLAEPLAAVVGYLLVSELFRAVFTIVPMTYSFGRYSGTTSDGKKLLQLLRS